MFRHLGNDDEDARRLAVLRSLDLLNGEVEPAVGEVLALAAHVTGAPMAALTLIGAAHQRVIATHGFESGDDLPREDCFCDHTIRQKDALVVEDTSLDTRFATSSLVRDEPHIRFYAGVAINARADDIGAAVGAICVMGTEPRSLGSAQRATLERLARVMEALIEARRYGREALNLAEHAHRQSTARRRQERIFSQAERLSMIGAWRYDRVSGALEWSEGVRRIHEVSADFTPTIETAIDFYPPYARQIVSDAIGTTVETGAPFDFETDLETASGRRIRVRSMGEAEREGDHVVAVMGVFQDVTDRYLMEEDLRRSAHVDALTGIANRAAFDHRLAQAFQRATLSETPLALVLIDLDGFKDVNDTHGHMVGDDVLRAYGARLRDNLLADAFAARLGGDEFALILEGPATLHIADRVTRLLGLMRRPIPSGDRLLQVPGTIGWASFAEDMETVRDLIHAADTALYEAKRNRRGTARAARRA